MKGEKAENLCSILLGTAFLLLTACTTVPRIPITSLCFLDFKNKMCWDDKEKGLGKTFAELEANQNMCFSNDNVSCWFAIDTQDLESFINP